MRNLCMATVLACCFLLPEASFAQLGPKGQTNQILSKVTPEQVAAALIQAGFASKVVTQDNERVVQVTMHGFNAFVFFYGCDKQGCQAYQFFAGFSDKVTSDYINAANQRLLFLKASMTNDGTFLTMDSLATGGITLDNVKENAKMFDSQVPEFFNPSS